VASATIWEFSMPFRSSSKSMAARRFTGGSDTGRAGVERLSPRHPLVKLANCLVHHGVPHNQALNAAMAIQLEWAGGNNVFRREIGLILSDLQLLRSADIAEILDRYRPHVREREPRARHSYNPPRYEEPRRGRPRGRIR
jgi:hypothetical protein